MKKLTGVFENDFQIRPPGCWKNKCIVNFVKMIDFVGIVLYN